MYKKFKETNMFGQLVEHVMLDKGNNEFVSFPNVEFNDGPERKAYLAWVAEGNTAEEIN